MRLPKKWFLAAIAISSIAAATFAVATGYPALTKVVVLDCGAHSVKPDTLTIYCADFGVNVNHIKWTKWAQSGATGTGQYSANNCTPNCAAGKVASVSVKLTLGAAKPIKSEYVMSTLNIASSNGKFLPLLKRNSDKWVLQ